MAISVGVAVFDSVGLKELDSVAEREMDWVVDTDTLLEVLAVALGETELDNEIVALCEALELAVADGEAEGLRVWEVVCDMEVELDGVGRNVLLHDLLVV